MVKRISIFIGIALLLCFVMPASAFSVNATIISTELPAITERELVTVAPYQISYPYSTPANRADGGCELIEMARNTRIRQNGNIEAVKFAIGDNTSLTDFKVKIWRFNTTSSLYEVIAVSENLASQINNGENYITLSSALPAQEGDYYGCYMNSSDIDAVFATSTVTGGDLKYIRPSEDIYAVGEQFNWTTGVTSPKQYTIALYMAAPTAVFIGDSTTTGVPGHRAFIVDTGATDIHSQAPYHFANNQANITYQNMGIGSENASMIRARFEADVVALHPQYAVIETGLNEGELITDPSKQQSILTDIEEMVQLCAANNITPILFEVPPVTSDTDVKAVGRNVVNAGIYELQETYQFMIFKNRDAVGELNETSGKWSIRSEYDADGIHYNVAGYTALGNALYDQMLTDVYIHGGRLTVGEYSWTTSFNNTSPTVIFEMGGLPVGCVMGIYRDGSLYENVQTDANGALTWVYDGGFSEHTFSIECHDFNASLTSGAYPLTTQFTTSSEGIDAYYWDFENDGIIDSTKQNPAHTYGQTGDYSVNLTVHTSEGNVSIVKPDYITVSAPAFASDPVAWFNWVFSYLFGGF